MKIKKLLHDDTMMTILAGIDTSMTTNCPLWRTNSSSLHLSLFKLKSTKLMDNQHYRRCCGSKFAIKKPCYYDCNEFISVWCANFLLKDSEYVEHTCLENDQLLGDKKHEKEIFCSQCIELRTFSSGYLVVIS